MKPKKPGRKPQAVPEALAAQVQALAERYPWWGYKRIAVVAGGRGGGSNQAGLPGVQGRGAAAEEAGARSLAVSGAKLFELLPQAPNELWQADVTYIHIPGHGWWYAVTVIDYYSRYLLACTDAELQRGGSGHGARYGSRGSRAHPRAVDQAAVSGDRQRLLVPRSHVSPPHRGAVRHVRIRTARRRSSDCWSGSIRRSRPRRCTGSSTASGRSTGLAGGIPAALQRRQAASGVGPIGTT